MVFQEIQCLHNFTMFVTSQSFISLPSLFVSAAVSEMHHLNQNKKEKKFEIFTTFPRHVSDQFFNESYLLTTSTH